MAFEPSDFTVAPPPTARQSVPAPNRVKLGGSPTVRQVSDTSRGNCSPRCWKRQESDGSRCSDYEIDFELDREEIKMNRQIGAGVSAIVYVADWKGKQVAVKQMRQEKARMSHKDQVSLAREVAILTQLSHPNLVVFYGTCFKTRPLLLVFELCEGGSLFEMLHNCMHIELTWEQRQKMLCDVATAVAYLHTQSPPVVHRDLKSLNLLLTRPLSGSSRDIPYVKVTDFGLARTKDIDDFVMTSHVGSIYWMAPEVIKGSRYDEKVDVYSFAMVLYEVVCREIPFDDFAPPEVAKKLLMGDRPELDFVPKDCPAALVYLLETCWAHDSALRPTFESILVTLRSPDLDTADSTSPLCVQKSKPLSELDRFHSLSGK